MADPNIDRVLTARINLYYDLYRDLRVPSTVPAPLLLALHGYGANKRQMMREAQQMAPDGFAIASLQGFHQHFREPREPGGPARLGFGWLTSYRPEESIAIHHQALLELTSLLVEEGIADSNKIFLLGFSQSCALNYRFAFTHPERLRGVIGICGGIPSDWDQNPGYKVSDLDVFHLAGNRDNFYPPERVRDYERQLATRARSVKFETYDATHDFVPQMREDVKQWLTTNEH
jgi:phospholipase/carboxylesterase